MNKTSLLPGNLRDQLFVLAWIALAVAAKYSVSYFTPGLPSASNLEPGFANAAVEHGPRMISTFAESTP